MHQQGQVIKLQSRAPDASRITIDLRHLSFIDSTGLGALARTCHRNDGRVHLIPGNGRVQSLFALTDFDRALPFAT